MSRRRLQVGLCTCLIGFAVALGGSAGAEPADKSSPDLRQVGTYTIGSEALTQELGGHVTATVDAGTRLRVSRDIQVELAPNKAATRCANIELLSGRIELHVPDGNPPPNSVMVQTPSGVSAIPLGGNSVVAASEKGSAVANVEGKVLVGSGSNWQQLKPGSTRSFARGAAAATHGIVGVPSLRARDALLLAPSGFGASTEVTVQGEGMVRFELSVSKANVGHERILETTGAPVTLTDLTPGRYQVIARGFDQWGISKGQSEPAHIDVLSYELPKDAHVANGVVYLLPGQRIRLHGSTDLEMTYGEKTQLFVPVPLDIGLGAMRKQVARIRVKGSQVEARLPMASRPFVASAEINPKAVRFPNDLVQVRVHLTDTWGQPLPRAAGVKKRLTVNSRRVNVRWRVDRGTLVANLPPQSGAGPWTVRIALQDQFGVFFTHSETLQPRGGKD